MDQESLTSIEEQKESPSCVLCGTKAGSYKFYHDAKDEALYLCTDCLKSAMQSLSYEQLDYMNVAQLKRHMEVRDQLASIYKNSFVATKTFCVGKKRDIPILEVDEVHGLWALPKAPMPLAQSFGSISDVDVSLDAGGFDDSGVEMKVEVMEGVKIKDIVGFLKSIFSSIYKSEHTDLAPIPKGHFVNCLNLILTLEAQESGISKVAVDLIPFWLSLPSRVDAGYDCAYDIVEFLKEIESAAYDKRVMPEEGLDLSCSSQLATLSEDSLMTEEEVETLRYYFERLPHNAEAYSSSYYLVKSVLDAISKHLLFGQKAPEWKTQHTASAETFFGAFYRYAPGLSLSDVVYIMDETTIQSGKEGILFAQECFAADDFDRDLEKPSEMIQPICYDDLLFVGKGAGKNQLVLAYRDGRRVEVYGGRYANVIFAAVNCILLLRAEVAGERSHTSDK